MCGRILKSLQKKTYHTFKTEWLLLSGFIVEILKPKISVFYKYNFTLLNFSFLICYHH